MQTRDLRANNFFAAKRLRRELTPTERVLWAQLRDRRLDGWKFRRQHPVGRFVLDFYCPDAALAVEVDGPVHLARRQAVIDADRQSLLEERGMRLLRVTTDAIERDIDSVLREIAEACANTPSPRARGEGRGVRC